MASTNTQKQAAKAFVQEWSGKGYEKGETQRFWLSLLHTVFGIDNPMKMMEFELPVKTITKEKGSDFIDAYIAVKMDEVTRLRMTTHPVEFDLYYSL